jgi:serine/threonine protein kinase
MDQTQDLVGAQLGAVRLTALLARGSMGVVYRGHHQRRNQDVAVKICTPGARPNAMKRFLRECRNAEQVHHPNVVEVIESQPMGDQAYLVLELVEGEDLLQRIERGLTVRGAGVARMLGQAAEGLRAIHGCGLVHRDIKPENLLIGNGGQVKIADLGLSASQANQGETKLTNPGCLVGTPLYLAPEYIRNPEAAGEASDLYALGATLYHAICGHPPFNDLSVYRVMEAHLERPPPPLPPEIEVSPALAALILRLLSKVADERPRPSELVEACRAA